MYLKIRAMISTFNLISAFATDIPPCSVVGLLPRKATWRQCRPPTAFFPLPASRVEWDTGRGREGSEGGLGFGLAWAIWYGRRDGESWTSPFSCRFQGVDEAYDLAVTQYFTPYHQFADTLLRAAFRQERVTETAIKCSKQAARVSAMNSGWHDRNLKLISQGSIRGAITWVHPVWTWGTAPPPPFPQSTGFGPPPTDPADTSHRLSLEKLSALLLLSRPPALTCTIAPSILCSS